MENKERKILILLSVFLVLILAVIFFVATLFRAESPKKVSAQYKTIITKNDLAQIKNFKEEKTNKDSEENIIISVDLIKKGILSRAKYTGLRQEEINASFNRTLALVTEKKFSKSLEETKKNIDTLNLAIEKYTKEHERDKDQIIQVLNSYLTNDARLANCLVSSDWAIATISRSDNIDPAMVILKKEGQYWIKILGPGTFFDKEKVSTLKIPKEILEADPLKIDTKLTPLKY